MLNKVLRYTKSGLELEADPRHAEIVVKDLGLTGAKISRVPGAKPAKKSELFKKGGREVLILDEEQCQHGDFPLDYADDDFELEVDDEEAKPDDDETPLEGPESTRYRAIAARLNYLAPDRMDIQYAVKEAARAMSTPKRVHWQMLHKIGRYLLGAPRMLIRFPWQVEQSTLTTFTDSDWAGCIRTARSTSGGIVAIGDHVIKTYSRQQKVVALSSAEAELYAMVAASAESLAIMSYARDLGKTLAGEVYTDSAAALGISQRAGIGKVRHLRTQGLWVQEVRVSGRLQYRKVLGTLNPSDVLTKHVPGDLLEKHVEAMGMTCPGGRAETAPELNTLEAVMVSWTGLLEDGENVHDARPRVARPRVRFAATVQFRAIPECNRGRRCGKDPGTRHPSAGVSHPRGKPRDAVKPRVTPEPASAAGGRWPLSAGGVGHQRDATDGTAGIGERPRWADLEDDPSCFSLSLFHGSVVHRSATMAPGSFGSGGIGTPSELWQAIDRYLGMRRRTWSWRHHTRKRRS